MFERKLEQWKQRRREADLLQLLKRQKENQKQRLRESLKEWQENKGKQND